MKEFDMLEKIMVSKTTVLGMILLLVSFGCGDSQQESSSEEMQPAHQTAPEPPPPVEAMIPESPVQQAEVGVRYIAFGMMLYYSHVGQLPSEEVGIDALLQKPHQIEGSSIWAGPYCEETVVKSDPWGNPYHYRLDESLPLRFEVWSTGPDGVKSEDDILASRDGRLPSLDEFEQGLAALKAGGQIPDSRGGSRPKPIPGQRDGLE